MLESFYNEILPDLSFKCGHWDRLLHCYRIFANNHGIFRNSRIELINRHRLINGDFCCLPNEAVHLASKPLFGWWDKSNKIGTRGHQGSAMRAALKGIHIFHIFLKKKIKLKPQFTFFSQARCWLEGNVQRNLRWVCNIYKRWVLASPWRWALPCRL